MKILFFCNFFISINCQNGYSENEVNLTLNATKRIINGSDSEGFPWLVAIWTMDGVQCGGSMIHDQWVLTAAHCVVGDPTRFDPASDLENIVTDDQFVDKTIIFDNTVNGPMYVKVGLIDQADSTADHIQTRQIVSAHCHQKFWKHSNDALDADICLLRLDAPITEDQTDRFPSSHLYNRHLCLPQQSDAPSRCIVAGWGFTEPNGQKSGRLQEAEVPLVSHDQCATWYAIDRINIQPNIHLCYGYEEGGIDSCQGDSGGPLVCQTGVSGTWEARGIVSFAIDCAKAERPGIYTNVYRYNEWIQSTINRVSPESNFTTTCGAKSNFSITVLFTVLFSIFRLIFE